MIGETRAAKAATERNLRMRAPCGGPELRLGNGYGTPARIEVLPLRAGLATWAAGGADVAEGDVDRRRRKRVRCLIGWFISIHRSQQYAHRPRAPYSEHPEAL